MTRSGNILIVFPHNFLEQKSGVNKRYFELARYLKEKGFIIDLLGLKHFESNWDTFDRDNSNKLINRLFLYNFRIGYHWQLFLSLLTGLIVFKKARSFPKKNQLPDYAFPGMVSLFNKIVTRKKYDYIIIGYVYWANLIKNNLSQGSVNVLTIEDFISYKLIETNQQAVDLTLAIQEEVERVNLFDKVICLSYEELQFFSNHACRPEYFYIPIFMQNPPNVIKEKEYDILFIGFDNADNIEGLKWFFNHVYPFLPKDLRIIIIGKIASFAPDLQNVKKLEFIQDLTEIYAKSKVSINPLQNGTGMKVKVIESLAHGIPIVNTSKGLCGIPPDILHEFIIADDPKKFANEILHLLSDKSWYEEKCSNSKNVFAKHFELSCVRKELDRVFSPS
ncbi:MAG: glycosyltransferase [Bacteroidota bacterium]